MDYIDFLLKNKISTLIVAILSLLGYYFIYLHYFIFIIVAVSIALFRHFYSFRYTNELNEFSSFPVDIPLQQLQNIIEKNMCEEDEKLSNLAKYISKNWIFYGLFRGKFARSRHVDAFFQSYHDHIDDDYDLTLDKNNVLEVFEKKNMEMFFDQKWFEENEQELLNKEDTSFLLDTLTTNLPDYLKKLMKEKKITSDELCIKANFSKKVLNKMLSDHYYIPSKKDLIKICFVLQLDEKESIQLLSDAYFYLDKQVLSDVIILYFIEKKMYDFYDVNSALHGYYQLPLY